MNNLYVVLECSRFQGASLGWKALCNSVSSEHSFFDLIRSCSTVYLLCKILSQSYCVFTIYRVEYAGQSNTKVTFLFCFSISFVYSWPAAHLSRMMRPRCVFVRLSLVQHVISSLSYLVYCDYLSFESNIVPWVSLYLPAGTLSRVLGTCIMYKKSHLCTKRTGSWSMVCSVNLARFSIEHFPVVLTDKSTSCPTFRLFKPSDSSAYSVFFSSW